MKKFNTTFIFAFLVWFANTIFDLFTNKTYSPIIWLFIAGLFGSLIIIS